MTFGGFMGLWAFLLFSGTFVSADSAYVIDCSYQFMGNPFSRVQVGVSSEGVPDDFVTIITQGQSRTESFAAETPSQGEILHGWLSKESPDNAVEMIVYEEMQPKGQSKLVNHNVPFAKEVWGTCSF